MAEVENLRITDDLQIVVGTCAAQLNPSQGLHFAEVLARKSFRRALTEEADASLGKTAFSMGDMR